MPKAPQTIEEVRAQQINSIRRRLTLLRNTAVDADRGNWRRDHGVITSTTDDGVASTIAFAEMSPEAQRKYWPYAAATDYTRSAKNTRHIVNTQPAVLLRLIGDLERVLEEVK